LIPFNPQKVLELDQIKEIKISESRSTIQNDIQHSPNIQNTNKLNLASQDLEGLSAHDARAVYA
jgi:hypothetical protein